MQDHLHIRGEYHPRELDLQSGLGSSPHTWRIPIYSHNLSEGYGIISTYVENTNGSSEKVDRAKDHLHIRGEYARTSNKNKELLGSSPHTWRIQLMCQNQKTVLRIISTYVENTEFSEIKTFTKQDHLHIRGEYLLR